MRKTLCAVLAFFMLLSPAVHADEMRTVSLDSEGHRKETVSLPYCNIFVELDQKDGEDSCGITVKVENISEDKILVLFDQAYNEKTLKKMSVVYDKVFQGAKGKRMAEPCRWLTESCRLAPSSETVTLFRLRSADDTLSCRLPIYIARHDEKNFIFFKKERVALVQKEVIELNVSVKLRPDSEFVALAGEADALIEEIGRQTFCSNRRHRGTPLRNLYSIYNSSIDELKGKVQKVITSRNYMSTDKGYKLFMGIYARLDSIDLEKLTVASCANDRVRRRAGHSCKYCSLTLDAIYKKMEAYYIDLHNGRKAKGQVMADVEALYNCAAKNRRRTDGSAYVPRITAYYNKIKSR